MFWMFTTSVTLVYRLVLKMGSWRTWNKFDWSDFLVMNRMAKTFKVRHLPLSNFESWKDSESFVFHPKAWKDKDEPRKKRAKVNPVHAPITVYNSSSSEEENSDQVVEEGDDTEDKDQVAGSPSDEDDDEVEDQVAGSPSDEDDDEKATDQVVASAGDENDDEQVVDQVAASASDVSDNTEDDIPPQDLFDSDESYTPKKKLSRKRKPVQAKLTLRKRNR